MRGGAQTVVPSSPGHELTGRHSTRVLRRSNNHELALPPPDEDGVGVAVPHGGWGRVGADGDGLGRAEFQALAKVAVHDEFVRSLATWSGEGELGREERVERRGGGELGLPRSRVCRQGW